MVFKLKNDRTETSKSLYFSEDIIEAKNEMINLLLDVDCNLSRFIKMLIPEIIRVCKMIKEKKQHFKMYTWKLQVELKDEYK